MEKIKTFILDTIKIVVIAVVIAFIITKFFMMSVVVTGSSMMPNLKENDRGVSFPIAKKYGIDRFDIVVIKKDDGTLIVKRVIGLPNETIKYEDDQLYINDELVEESFEHALGIEDFEFTNGNDEYFVIGDNRPVSLDSRYTGPYKFEDIKAKGLIVLYPFADFGRKG